MGDPKELGLLPDGLPPLSKEKMSQWKATLRKERSRRELVRLLDKTLIFANTVHSFRSGIIDFVVPVQLGAGEAVFKQGQPGDWLGIVIAGQCRRVLDRGGKQIPIGEVNPGGIFGDLGLLGISPIRSFTIVTTCPTTILVLTRANYERTVADHGGVQSLTTLSQAAGMQNLLVDVTSFLVLECFHGLAREFVLKLRDSSEPRIYYPNQVLMREGHYGNEMYILRHGSVRLERDRKLVEEVGSGSVLGEYAVLGQDKRRKFTAICTSLCLIRALHADVFHDIVARYPDDKRVFEHRFIAKVVHIDVHNAKDERSARDKIHGSVMPRSAGEVDSLLGKDKGVNMFKARFKTQMTLPPITPRSLGLREPMPAVEDDEPPTAPSAGRRA